VKEREGAGFLEVSLGKGLLIERIYAFQKDGIVIPDYFVQA
jgi:hypothetical protein